MKKIKCFVIEDDLIILDWMENALQKIPIVEFCGSAQDVDDAVSKIDVLEPDLLLSDIELGAESAFSMLEKTSYKDFYTIFVTSYEDFALEAFKVKAYDYLTKPISMDTLRATLDDFYEFWMDKSQIKILVPLLNMKLGKERMAFHHSGFLEFTDVDDILFFEADENYCTVHIRDKKSIVISKPLKFYADKLRDNSSFLRIHQSYLININHISKVIMTKLPQAIMSNGKHLNVSRSKKSEFVARIME